MVAALVLLSTSACNAQIKNARTDIVKIYGNCGMCENTIEMAGNIKKVATVDWDENTETATITYDTTKTNKEEILKKVALSGYDSDMFLAPNDIYAQLPKCCQYERKAKVTITASMAEGSNHEEHTMHNPATNSGTQAKTSQLKAVFDSYFELKDALVNTDGSAASLKARDLAAAVNTVKMEALSTEEHAVWMKVMKDIVFDAEHIAETQDASHQRDHFMSLSKNMYELAKVYKQAEPVYYIFCPMANNGKGANWLSLQSVIQNPYYGAQMLSCGKVVEVLK